MPGSDQLSRPKHATASRGPGGEQSAAARQRAGVAAWIRSHRLLTALGGVVIVCCLAAVVLVGSSGGSGSGAARSRADSQAAQKADSSLNATRQAGKQPPTGPSAGELAVRTKGTAWFAGSGGKLLGAVNTDVGTLNKAIIASDHAAAEAAGAQLAKAAQSALGGKMPPVDAATYVKALQGFQRAGRDAVRGALTAAESAENVSELYIAKVTSALDEPSKKQPPGS